MASKKDRLQIKKFYEKQGRGKGKHSSKMKKNPPRTKVRSVFRWKGW